MPDLRELRAAGVDAPLFYSRSGARYADTLVRDAIRDAGAPHSAGTVQHPNSLRGACLVQGLLAATELLDRFPCNPISESHPKALVWLDEGAESLTAPSEHERDAVIATLSAWACVSQPDTWCDLRPLEPAPFRPLGGPVSYWMPSSIVRPL